MRASRTSSAVAALRHGDATALVDGSSRWSFRELEQQMLRSVKAAMALGIKPGDRVGLCAPNSAEWIVAALGIQGGLTGSSYPLNTRFKAQEQAYILRTCGASAVFASSFLGNDYIAALAAYDPGFPRWARPCPSWGRVGPRPCRGANSWHPGGGFDTAVAQESINVVTPDSIADVIFTSGTTGHPKGVILTHGQSLRAYGWMSEEYVPARRQLPRRPAVLPLLRLQGGVAGVADARRDRHPRRSSTPDRHWRPSPANTSRSRSDRRAIFQDLIRHPARPSTDLSSLRVSMTGGTTIPEQLVHAMKSDLGFDIVMSAYGLTESSALVTSTRVGDAAETVARTTGRPIPGVEVRIADDDGNDVPTGHPGEILVRGFNVTRGYWDDPEATAETVDPFGWLHTGDIGQLDADGNLAIVDRKKEMFIVGGFNAYPAEIEKLLLGYPPVEQAAVVGVPDERLGEVGCVFVVPRPGAALDQAELIAWARRNMANFKGAALRPRGRTAPAQREPEGAQARAAGPVRGRGLSAGERAEWRRRWTIGTEPTQECGAWQDPWPG
ncbi:AMP-binding protein [Yinghuangia aomiensis]